MRFFFVSLMKGHNWGGSEELWSRTASVLASRGHTVMASVDGMEPLSEKLAIVQNSGVRLQRRSQKRASLSWRLSAKLRRKEPDAFQIERFQQQMEQMQPDLVCISNGSVVDDVRYLEAALGHSETRVVNISQANAEQWWPTDRAAERNSTALRGCVACYFVSHGNLSLWETQVARDVHNASVVRNPFNVSYQSQPTWPSSVGCFKLACVARLDPRSKGQDILLKVMALPEWRERPFSLSFYGQGPMEQNLRRLAQTLELEDRVHFCGHVNNIEKLWETHHALVLPSRYEGLPLALVEAMLCHRMAIVTNVAGNAEVVDDEFTGFVAEAPTVRHLAQTLERAWNRREEWRQIGLEAGARIRTKVPMDPSADLADRLVSLASVTA
jgi:glycosyltransferase involved in cell wall biosynthesis